MARRASSTRGLWRSSLTLRSGPREHTWTCGASVPERKSPLHSRCIASAPWPSLAVSVPGWRSPYRPTVVGGRGSVLLGRGRYEWRHWPPLVAQPSVGSVPSRWSPPTKGVGAFIERSHLLSISHTQRAQPFTACVRALCRYVIVLRDARDLALGASRGAWKAMNMSAARLGVTLPNSNQHYRRTHEDSLVAARTWSETHLKVRAVAHLQAVAQRRWTPLGR
jgi:hypothetical protein